ncbi:MAG: xanthine dehydrogenase family protein molybdopterin-binding subunit [Hyphomicrobiaceae bacterium]
MTKRWGEFQGRIEDDRLVAGKGQYVADLALPGMSYGVVVRAQVAHAQIKSIDTAAALEHPGVLAVFTAKDLADDGLPDFPCDVALTQRDGSKVFPARRPVLARDRIRAVGQGVAFVVAETQAAADAAAELVTVDTDDLPAVVDHNAARAADAPKVWDEVADNVAFTWSKGDFQAALASIKAAPQVARLESHVTRVAALSLEPRGCIGEVDANGRLVLHAANQSPHNLKSAVAKLMNIEAAKVRVVARDVGGSFGMKSGAYPEDVLVLFAARRLKRPVRWISERRESFLSDDHGRDIAIKGELALDKDGMFLALAINFDVNIGAFLSGRSTFLINNIGGIAGVYRIPIIAADVVGVFTNTSNNAAYRGAGRPEATYVLERLIDIAAGQMGIEPFELRRRNLVPPSAMPYDTGFVFKYDCGEFEGNMTGVAKLADLAGFPARRAEAERRGQLRGLGMANPIEVAGGPFTKPGKDHTKLVVHGDGTATLHAGVMSVGQGIETAFTDMVAEKLGLTRDKIKYVFGDTDDLPTGRGNGGSSSIPVGGAATLGAIDKVIATGKALATELLEANVDDIDFRDGGFHLRGTNHSAGLADVAKLAEKKSPAGLAESADFMPPAVTFPNGCHMCEVEVDPETGTVKIIRYSIVEDIGNVINETLARGQIQGGVAMGIGQALGELISYDAESGQLMTGSFMDYQMPRAEDVPMVNLQTRAVPTKVNPLGAKGVGEAGTVGSLVATINAICDALGPLGVKHIEMPATPARVWAAIQAAKQPGR